jgi:hypothetical protein
MERRQTGWRGRYFSAMGFDDKPANGEAHAGSVLCFDVWKGLKNTSPLPENPPLTTSGNFIQVQCRCHWYSARSIPISWAPAQETAMNATIAIRRTVESAING